MSSQPDSLERVTKGRDDATKMEAYSSSKFPNDIHDLQSSTVLTERQCARLDLKRQIAVSNATFHFHEYSQHYRTHPGTHVLACLQNVPGSHLTQATKITYSTLELQSSALHHQCRVNVRVIRSTVYIVNENAYDKSANGAQALRGRFLLSECYPLARYAGKCDFI